MKFLTEVWNRFSLETPSFFQLLQKLAIIAGILSGLPLIIVEFQTHFPNIIIPSSVTVIAGKVTLISAIVLWVVSKLPVKPTELTKALAQGKLPYTKKQQMKVSK